MYLGTTIMVCRNALKDINETWYASFQGTMFAYRNYFCAPLDIRDTFYCLRFILQGMGTGSLHDMTVMFSLFLKKYLNFSDLDKLGGTKSVLIL
jgi:hypothetical protein